MKKFPDLPPIWLFGHMGAALLLGQVPLGVFASPPATTLGRALVALGLGVVIWSAWWFWRKRTAIEPGHRPTALIVEGPYRINRNPIYTGMLVILFGFALTVGTVPALLPCISFPLIITARFIRDEEAGLREVFGSAAEDYVARSRRW
ncbi:MAG: methyltransferase [Pseudomonadota bacterium]